MEAPCHPRGTRNECPVDGFRPPRPPPHKTCLGCAVEMDLGLSMVQGRGGGLQNDSGLPAARRERCGLLAMCHGARRTRTRVLSRSMGAVAVRLTAPAMQPAYSLDRMAPVTVCSSVILASRASVYSDSASSTAVYWAITPPPPNHPSHKSTPASESSTAVNCAFSSDPLPRQP